MDIVKFMYFGEQFHVLIGYSLDATKLSEHLIHN